MWQPYLDMRVFQKLRNEEFVSSAFCFLATFV
jgi:hypothetical protein